MFAHDSRASSSSDVFTAKAVVAPTCRGPMPFTDAPRRARIVDPLVTRSMFAHDSRTCSGCDVFTGQAVIAPSRRGPMPFADPFGRARIVDPLIFRNGVTDSPSRTRLTF